MIKYKEDKISEQMKELVTNEPQLQLVTGGKEPPGFVDLGWLQRLSVGTVFLFDRRNSKDWTLGKFEIGCHTQKATLLYFHPDDDKEQWIKPIDFCKEFYLIEILKEGDNTNDV